MQKKDKEKLMLKEIISSDYDISETFNIFFSNIIRNLKMIPNENIETAIQYEAENPMQNARNKFKNHPSIYMIALGG